MGKNILASGISVIALPYSSKGLVTNGSRMVAILDLRHYLIFHAQAPNSVNPGLCLALDSGRLQG